MNDEKWAEVSNLIEQKFDIIDHGKEDLDPGELEYYEFDSPLGRTRIERTVRPKLLDRKMHSSARIGAEGREERVYSEDETVAFMHVFIYNDETEEWVEAEAGKNLFE